jgi:type IV pilus assembly protein PilE
MAQANVSSRVAGTGFTLVEAVVALAIAAVVGAVAYPSYTAQLRKSRRADAVVALMQVEQAQERWRGSHRTYAAELGTPPPLGLGLRGSSADGYYTLSLSDASAAGYAVTATAVPGRSQAADSVCATLAVTVRRGNVQRLPPGCWTR